MKLIAELNNDSITRKEKIIGMIYEIILTILLIVSVFQLQDIKIFLFLPVLVILTLFIHECIHVSLFKAFNKNAKIKIVHDGIKNIYMYQYNQNVYYTRNQTLVVLLSPLLGISFLSILLLFLINSNLIALVAVNGVINAMGSMTDLLLSLRLMTYDTNVRINYENKEKFTLNIYEKE